MGNYRRKNFGAEKNAEFFNPSNAEAVEQRKQAAIEALKDMSSWFEKETMNGKSAVAIYDATNSTKSRREMIQEYCNKSDIHVNILSIICTNFFNSSIGFVYREYL